MSINLYKEFLLEEERFLKGLERNLKDQINRLSVEELSILKLISSKDPTQFDDVSNHGNNFLLFLMKGFFNILFVINSVTHGKLAKPT